MSDTNQAVQPQKMVRDLIFKKERSCTTYVAKMKRLMSCVITAQLIFAFAFAYAKHRFSYDAAHFRALNITIFQIVCTFEKAMVIVLKFE